MDTAADDMGVCALCLTRAECTHGEDLNVVLAGQREDEGPAGDECLLVRQADILRMYIAGGRA